MFDTPAARILLAGINAAAVVAAFMLIQHTIGDERKVTAPILSERTQDPVTTGSTRRAEFADWCLRGTLD